MRRHVSSVVLTLFLALFVAGCETDGGIAARTKEKSATYAKLHLWQKRFIDKGVVAVGFTPDMVYMAVGNPSKIEPVGLPDGRKAELWTYSRYYPALDAAHMQYAPYTTESHYQTARKVSGDGSSFGNGQIPVGMDKGNHGQTLGAGPPQGGSGEPADLQSFTLRVLFQGGKIVKMGVDPNSN